MTFKEALDFLLSVCGDEELFMQMLNACENSLFDGTFQFDPWIRHDYQVKADQLVAHLSANALQRLSDYSKSVESIVNKSGFALAIHTAIKSKRSKLIPTAPQKTINNAWTAASSSSPTNALSKEAIRLKENLAACMCADTRDILLNLESIFQTNEQIYLSSLQELVKNGNERAQLTSYAQQLCNITSNHRLVQQLVNEIGSVLYPAISDINEVQVVNKTTEEVFIALCFYATQTNKKSKKPLIFEAAQLMAQHYDHDFFTNSEDIFVIQFVNMFVPNINQPKAPLLLSEDRINILHQLLITDTKHAIALALGIIERIIFANKNQMLIHQLVALLQKALKDTGTERVFFMPNPGTPIQVYREQMISDLLKSFDKTDKLQVKQAKSILHTSMTVDLVVKQVQQSHLENTLLIMRKEALDEKLYQGIYKGETFLFEKPLGVAPRPVDRMYEIFNVTKETIIQTLRGLPDQERLRLTLAARRFYIESYQDKSNNFNNSAIDIAVKEYHIAHQNRCVLTEKLTAAQTAAEAQAYENSKTHKRARDEDDASTVNNNTPNVNELNTSLTAMKIEIMQVLEKIAGIINANPHYYQKYLDFQSNSPYGFNVEILLAYARTQGINLCLWTKSSSDTILLNEEAISSPIHPVEIKKTIYLLFDFYWGFFPIRLQGMVQPEMNLSTKYTYR